MPLDGRELEDVKLFSNIPLAIKHGLGRKQRGWIITDQSGEATIVRKRPFNEEILVLESTANTTIKLWVY